MGAFSMLTRLPLALIAATLSSGLFTMPVQAQRARVFVASYGNDSNPCTFGSPCKIFQQAINVVAVGGEVTAIDSAGFGTITISHSVTITSPPGVEAGIAAPASGAAAITINAGPGDIINASGLTLNGANVPNSTGIAFNSGGRLNIQDTVIRNFTGDGILFNPNSTTLSQIYVANTLIADNGGGISIGPSGVGGRTYGALDHVKIENSVQNGLFVQTLDQEINLTVSESEIASNGEAGILANSLGGTEVNVMVRNSTIANNVGDGLDANGSTGTEIRITRCMITGNKGNAWATASGGFVFSYGDNTIDNNTSSNGLPPLKPYK